MTAEPDVPPAVMKKSPEARRQAANAVRLWAGTTVSLVSVLTTLAIWHLIRRGRLIRQGLGPAKPQSTLTIPPRDTGGAS